VAGGIVGINRIGGSIGKMDKTPLMKNKASAGKAADSEPINGKNFKNWFGDWENDPTGASKVVDERGSPLVVYHDTKENFDVFDINKARNYSDTDKEMKSFYFTPDKNYNFVPGGRKIEAYVDIKNPVPEFPNDKFYDANGNLKFSSEELKKMGFDGIIDRNPKTGKIFIVRPFSANQIKSATSNSGKFSKLNPNIMKVLPFVAGAGAVGANR
jgi:hypothetical protein